MDLFSLFFGQETGMILRHSVPPERRFDFTQPQSALLCAQKADWISQFKRILRDSNPLVRPAWPDSVKWKERERLLFPGRTKRLSFKISKRNRIPKVQERYHWALLAQSCKK